jgi:cell division protein FtsB
VRQSKPYLIGLSGSLIVIYATFMLVNNVPRVLAKRAEVQRMETDNADLRRRLEMKRQYRDDLNSNPTVIDTEIRRQLGVSKKSESVFTYPR